jgi:nitrous oxidase accessory protein NosD
MKSVRTKVTAWHLGFFLVALPLLLAVGPNSCLIDVQCGDVLDINYGQYRLNGDLVCPNNPSGAAVTITGEGVHFNLAGYTITRDDVSGRFLLRGIAVRGANAHIRGGSIVDINCPVTHDQNCSAIRLFEAPGARINGMSLNNNTIGITSFTSGNADGARIHGNDITGNHRIGIGLFGTAFDARITGNDLSDTGGFPPDPNVFIGVGYLGTSDDVSVIGNVANNCETTGILLFGAPGFPPALGNTIRGNTTLDNGFGGISVIGTTEALRARDNLIQSNTAFGNAIRDLTDGIIGIPPLPAADCLNTWIDNDFDVAAPDCIQ